METRTISPLGRDALAKEVGRAAVREMVLAELAPLVQAQIAKAKGIKHLQVRNKKTGKFERETRGISGSRGLGQHGVVSSTGVWDTIGPSFQGSPRAR